MDEERIQNLLSELERSRSRLQDAELALEAAKRGEQQPIIILGPSGEQVYSRAGADRAFRILFETMNEGAAILGEDGTVFFCNAALSDMLETSREDLAGTSILRFVPPGDRPTLKRLIRASLRQPKKKEFTLRAGKGAAIPTRVSTAPLSIEAVPAICMILTDIADFKQAEAALRESEESLRAIFEASQDAIFVKDMAGRFVRVNPAGETFFEQPPDKLIGRKQEDFAANEEEAKHIEDIVDRVRSGQTIEEQRTLTIHGVRSVWKIVQMPMYDASGSVIGLSGIARDITDWQREDFRNPAVTENPPYRSPAMRSTLRLAETAAPKDFTVLLLGESGSGKDFLARYIHDHSKRAHGPYFSVNCAAISPELAESELFGHEKGAFTGAASRKRGLLELAEGGTLLLNEIGDLSLPLQSKLLTFLDTRKFIRVGGEKEIRVDVRLIAATNKELEKDVQEGTFRADLFYRLNGIAIVVPPLRKRLDDIPVLVHQMLMQLHTELQISEMPVVDTTAVNYLKQYKWPGNVRELRNVIERSIMLSQGRRLNLAELVLDGHPGKMSADGKTGTPSFQVSFPIQESLPQLTENLKKFLIREALRYARDSRQKAADLLGISRFALRRYMQALGNGDEDESKRESSKRK
jgi:PAS domain S-box-containing protein